jgi:hypothetical protein
MTEKRATDSHGTKGWRRTSAVWILWQQGGGNLLLLGRWQAYVQTWRGRFLPDPYLSFVINSPILFDAVKRLQLLSYKLSINI